MGNGLEEKEKDERGEDLEGAERFWNPDFCFGMKHLSIQVR